MGSSQSRMFLNIQFSRDLEVNKMDSVDRLLKYDPIAEEEKISGKGHWSNFSEQDNMLALLLNMQHA